MGVLEGLLMPAHCWLTWLWAQPPPLMRALGSDTCRTARRSHPPSCRGKLPDVMILSSPPVVSSLPGGWRHLRDHRLPLICVWTSLDCFLPLKFQFLFPEGKGKRPERAASTQLIWKSRPCADKGWWASQPHAGLF